jgi:hypothetical protein
MYPPSHMSRSLSRSSHISSTRTVSKSTSNTSPRHSTGAVSVKIPQRRTQRTYLPAKCKIADRSQSLAAYVQLHKSSMTNSRHCCCTSTCATQIRRCHKCPISRRYRCYAACCRVLNAKYLTLLTNAAHPQMASLLLPPPPTIGGVVIV